MKVYVYSDSWQFDSGDVGQDIKVYSTIEKAKEAMKESIKEAKLAMTGFDTESESDDTYYSIWEKGEYCYNHINITIQELDVE